MGEYETNIPEKELQEFEEGYDGQPIQGESILSQESVILKGGRRRHLKKLKKKIKKKLAKIKKLKKLKKLAKIKILHRRRRRRALKKVVKLKPSLPAAVLIFPRRRRHGKVHRRRFFQKY